jgi:hypothetical protein
MRRAHAKFLVPLEKARGFGMTSSYALWVVFLLFVLCRSSSVVGGQVRRRPLGGRPAQIYAIVVLPPLIRTERE